MDNFEEDLTCSVCYSIFEDPRVLPCSHTFCRTCLENIIQGSGNFSVWRPLRFPLKCPTCRSIVELPATGIVSLPINFSLMGIIEKYQREDHPKTPTCPDHCRQPLNMFCLLDRKLVCGYCLTVGQHQGHPIDDLQNAYVKEKQTAHKLVEQLSDKRWAVISVFIEQLVLQKAQAEQIIQQDKDTVERYFEDLQRTLRTKKDALLAALDEVNAKIASEYDPLIHKMSEMKEEQLALETFGAFVEEEKDALTFLENIHIYRQRVDTLIKTKLPVIRPLDIQPRVGHFLMEKWSKITVGHIEQAPIPQVKHCLENHWIKDLASHLKRGQGLSRKVLTTGVLIAVLFLLAIFSLSIFLKESCIDVFNVTNSNLPNAQATSWESVFEVCSRLQSLKTVLENLIETLMDFVCQLTAYLPGIYQIFGFQLSNAFQYATNSLWSLFLSESHEQA